MTHVLAGNLWLRGRVSGSVIHGTARLVGGTACGRSVWAVSAATPLCAGYCPRHRGRGPVLARSELL